MDNNYFDARNTITKSNQLIESKYKLTLQQQKIVCAVASKIRLTDTELTEYTFHIKGLAELLELNIKGYYAELRKVIRSLQTQVITIDKIIDNEVRSVDLNWFYKAEYNETKNIVSLKFAEELKPFLIQLKNNFTSYQLENVVKLDSSYSLRLYEILRSKTFMKNKSFEIPLEELYSMILNQYKRYTDFKKNVLEKCKKEINSKTDISFDYEEIKTGRKITSLKFYIKQSKTSKNEIAVTSTETIKGQQTIEDIANIQLVKSIVDNINDDGAMAIFNAAAGDIQKIKEKYSVISKFKEVKNLTGAMIQAIKEDWTSQEVNNRTFNNFEGREYNYEELEKKLLGWG